MTIMAITGQLLLILALVVGHCYCLSCYNDSCGVSTYTAGYSMDFSAPCVEPFNTTGIAKCSGEQCLTQWAELWAIENNKNVTKLRATTRNCVTSRSEGPPPLPFTTADDCVQISEKYTQYKQNKFFAYGAHCCYTTTENYVTDGNSYTACFCLSDNCNDIPSKPSDQPSSASPFQQQGNIVIFFIVILLIMNHLGL